MQPMDVSINRPFNATIRERWMQWMAAGPPVTPRGYETAEQSKSTGQGFSCMVLDLPRANNSRI